MHQLNPLHKKTDYIPYLQQTYHIISYSMRKGECSCSLLEVLGLRERRLHVAVPQRLQELLRAPLRVQQHLRLLPLLLRLQLEDVAEERLADSMQALSDAS